MLALPGVHTRKNKTGRERAEEVRGGRRRSFQLSVSQSGFVNMKCAVRFAKDKSGIFACKFQRVKAIYNLSAGPVRAILFLPPSGGDFQGLSSSGDLRVAGRRR